MESARPSVAVTQIALVVPEHVSALQNVQSVTAMPVAVKSARDPQNPK